MTLQTEFDSNKLCWLFNSKQTLKRLPREDGSECHVQG